MEINQILAAKGFVHTRVEPVANPNRFFLGVTTPRETHDMLTRLVNGTLLSAASTEWFLRVLRWVNGYHDGVRREMSSDERSRVATKYGADFNTLGGSRHEAGVMFGTDGSPALTYAMFADAHPDQNNYGATHPVVQAHSVIGRVLFDSIATTAAPAARSAPHPGAVRAVQGGLSPAARWCQHPCTAVAATGDNCRHVVRGVGADAGPYGRGGRWSRSAVRACVRCSACSWSTPAASSSADRLIDGLYGENPPAGAANALQSQVSRLRRALGGTARTGAIEFHPAGYRLAVDPDDTDLHRFERLAAAGRRALVPR